MSEIQMPRWTQPLPPTVCCLSRPASARFIQSGLYSPILECLSNRKSTSERLAVTKLLIREFELSI